MTIIEAIIHKLLVFEKEPQKIGLSQFKEDIQVNKKITRPVKNKDVKLSDLMRKAT